MNKLAIMVSIVAIATLDLAVFTQAYAQQVTIRTSADGLGGSFFGEGVLQIVITDPDADSDSDIEDITVEIDADPDSGSAGS
ncbi:MAG: hypothetical protein MN733_36055, partial [Nitrososphaera sp.]|nr:hypothetical protein [Nitrososphaera sp.]